VLRIFRQPGRLAQVEATGGLSGASPSYDGRKGVLMARFLVLLLLLAGSLASQLPQDPRSDGESAPARMPNGKLQSEEILKAEHARSLEDVAKLIKIAEELEDELIKNDRHVLSISSLKKAEEIEKLAKKLKGRIRK
jgi:hypothetical protein